MALPAVFDLSGRTAVVTGAGSPDGIGFATAALLGSMGAAVLVTSTTVRIEERADELRRRGIDCAGAVADLTVEAEANAVVAGATARWGAVDIVVNNAGMISVSDPEFESGDVGSMSTGTWQKSLARNLDTAFLVSRAAVPGMAERGWGRVVMVTSVTGAVMAMRDDVGYATAKAGMVGLTRAMAVDAAGRGVTVNAVAPGWIATASQTAHEVEEGRATPAGRSGTPAEVSTAIGWLCSPGASYVTGQCLVVDGGNSVAEERGRIRPA
jgi:3-oxoacyl-[acyl-carrier protein] reductase